MLYRIFLLTWLLFGGMGNYVYSVPAKLHEWEKLYSRLQKRSNEIEKDKKELFAKIQKASLRISLLKEKIQEGGLSSVSAKLQLPYERRNAQLISNQLEKMMLILLLHKKKISVARIRWIQQLENSLNEPKLSLATKRKYQTLLANLKQQQAKEKSKHGSSLVSVETPEELKQKQDMLQDIGAKLKRKLQKVIRFEKEVLKRKSQEKQDQKLVEDMNDLTQQDQVFDDNARSPRMVKSNTSGLSKDVSNQPIIREKQQIGFSSSSALPSVAQQRLTDLPGLNNQIKHYKLPDASDSFEIQLQKTKRLKQILEMQLKQVQKEIKIVSQLAKMSQKEMASKRKKGS